MSVLQKDFTITVIPGKPGVEATYSILPTSGYWLTKLVVPGGISNLAVNFDRRFATWTEIRILWPTLTTDCAVEKKILKTIRTTKYLEKPLMIIDASSYMALSTIDYNGRNGVGLIVITGNPKDYVLRDNPQYVEGYVYNGEIAGCP